MGDPATPLASAKHMAEYFDGSAVVAQNSGGHGVTTVVSSCTLNAITMYFETGQVPQNGTVCETDGKPLVDGKVRRGVEAAVGIVRWS